MPDETVLETTPDRDPEDRSPIIFLPEDDPDVLRHKANLYVDHAADQILAQAKSNLAGGSVSISDVLIDLEEELRQKTESNLTPFGTALDDAPFVNRVRSAVRNSIFVQLDSILNKAIALDSGHATIVSPGETAVDNLEVVADPVMAFNGQFVHTAQDLVLKGAGIDFVFARTYKNQATYEGPLGHNWDHNYNLWLRVSADGNTIIRSAGSLREDRYVRHETLDYFVPPDGQDGVLLANGGSFVWRGPDGRRCFYRQDNNNPLTFVHILDRIEDRFGNFLQLTYDDNSRLRQVTVNHPSRFALLEYDEHDRIISLRDHTHASSPRRIWRYIYDDFGDLISITTPGTDQHPHGLMPCYEYSSWQFTGELQHNLTRIIDAQGQLYLENEYGAVANNLAFNRVVRQRQGSGETFFDYADVNEPFEFSYADEHRPAHQTTIIERNGSDIRHIFNRFGNELFKEQCVFLNGLPQMLRTFYRYNRDGKLIATLSPEGTIKQFLYGRDLYLRLHSDAHEDALFQHPNLTQQERQGFGRLLAVVSRARTFTLQDLNLARGVWGDLFPDIIGARELDAQGNVKDIIVKYSYETEFNQVETISHPRFTDSPLPGTQSESDPVRHTATLTHYRYTGPTRLLTEMEYPQPTTADNQLGPISIKRFPQYDNRGRLERSVNTVGITTAHQYFDDPAEVTEGFLQQTVMDVGGLDITTQLVVDDLARVTEVHLPKAAVTADGRFIARTSYNELDQAVATTTSEPFSFRTQHFYDRTGKLERAEYELKDENSMPILGGASVATYCYDEEFNLLESAVGGLDPAERLVTKYCYDGSGKRTLTILPQGNQVRAQYDERLLLVSQTAGASTTDAATTRTDYDGNGRVSRQFDARGNATIRTYDAFDRLMAEEDALGHIVRINYDKSGNIICTRMFERRATNVYFLLSRSEAVYDERNRVILSGSNRFDDPIGPFLRNQLNDAELSSPGPGNLLQAATFYDAQGRVERTVDSMGRETRYQYDAFDRLALVVDPLGNETRHQYDAHNNLIRTDQRDRILDVSGNEVGLRFFASSATYDELDRQTSSTDSLGNTTQLFYDSRGNVVRQVDPLGNEQRNAFDIFNRPVNATRFLTATGLGPVTPNAIPVVTAQEYDRNSNVIAVVDALGRRTGYLYDALDRHRATVYPDESQMRIDYDVDSHIVRTQDNNGLQRIHTVDALGRTIRIDVDKSGLQGNLEVAGATFEQFVYDGMDRQVLAENDFAVCTYRFNSLNWPFAETIQYTVNEAPIKTPFVVSRQFDDIGAVVGLTYPNGRRLRLDRDTLNRLIRIQNLANGTEYPGDPTSLANHSIAQLQYAGRQRSRIDYTNGASTAYRHDGAGRIIEIAHSSSSGPLLAIQYLYDAVSNVRVRNDELSSGPRTERFGYDSLYRLAHEFKPDSDETFALSVFGPATSPLGLPLPDRQSIMTALIGPLTLPQDPHTFDYDLVGNRETERPSAGNDIGYTKNSLDQYTSRDGVTAIHDANGNQIQGGQRNFVFDSLNRLVAVKDVGGQEITHYWHDVFGRRILERSIDAGTITQLIHDGNNNISEYRAGTLLAQYVFNVGIDRPLHMAGQKQEHWYHVDLVGSVRRLTNTNGDSPVHYRYTSFGTLTDVLGSDVFNPWRYTARRFDAQLGTYDYRARQYDPQTGRFVQRDPKGMSDGTNLYTAVQSSPLYRIDPFGTESRQPMEAQWPTFTTGGGSDWLDNISIVRDVRHIDDMLHTPIENADGRQVPFGVLLGTAAAVTMTDSETNLNLVEKHKSTFAQIFGKDAVDTWHFNLMEEKYAREHKSASEYLNEELNPVYGILVHEYEADRASRRGDPMSAIKHHLGAGFNAAQLTPVFRLRISPRLDTGGGIRPSPGVIVRKSGNYYVKEVDANAGRLARWFGQRSLIEQNKALGKLGDMAPSHLFRNGKLITRDAGVHTPGNFWKTWLEGSKRLGTPMNDIRPRNIGANGIIFDPALDPIVRGVYWIGAGTLGAGAVFGYQWLEDSE